MEWACVWGAVRRVQAPIQVGGHSTSSLYLQAGLPNAGRMSHGTPVPFGGLLALSSVPAYLTSHRSS